MKNDTHIPDTSEQPRESDIDDIVKKSQLAGDRFIILDQQYLRDRIKELLSLQQERRVQKIEGMKKIDNDGKVNFGDASAHNQALNKVLELLKEEEANV